VDVPPQRAAVRVEGREGRAAGMGRGGGGGARGRGIKALSESSVPTACNGLWYSSAPCTACTLPAHRAAAHPKMENGKPSYVRTSRKTAQCHAHTANSLGAGCPGSKAGSGPSSWGPAPGSGLQAQTEGTHGRPWREGRGCSGQRAMPTKLVAPRLRWPGQLRRRRASPMSAASERHAQRVACAAQAQDIYGAHAVQHACRQGARGGRGGRGGAELVRGASTAGRLKGGCGCSGVQPQEWPLKGRRGLQPRPVRPCACSHALRGPAPAATPCTALRAHPPRNAREEAR
jgi:hypothetical protein